jgi:MoaA/NifB/PqqE/SkfB family radical SAM enzyme
MTARAWREHRLLSALLELTYRCNLDCFFCYNDLSLQGRPLTREQWLSLLDELQTLGALNLTLSGGEPLAHPDFFAIGAHARERGFVVRVKSNGHGLSGPVARRLREQVDPFLVEISLHGATAASHDRQTRVAGSFDRLRRQLPDLRAAGLRVKLNATLTRWNEDEVEAMFALADSLGLPLQFDPEVTPRDDGDRAPTGIAPTREGLLRLFRTEFARGERAAAAAGSRDADRTLPVPTDRHCGAGASGIAVDPYGNVYPCVQWRRRIGSLHERRLAELWAGSPALDAVRRATVEAKQRLAARSDAALLNFCPGLAEATSGDPLAVYAGAEQRAEAIRRVDGERRRVELRVLSG